MKSTVVLLCCSFATTTALFCGAQQPDNSGTYSTPSYDGSGSRTSRGTSQFGTTGTGATRTNANFGGSFGTSLGTNLGTVSATNLGTVSGTNFGQSLGVNGGAIIGQTNMNVGVRGTGTALAPGRTAISPAGVTNTVRPLAGGPAIPPLDATNTIVRPGNVGIGQQGTIGIGQPTVGIGQQGTTALGQQGTGTAITPPQPNGFIINADGTVTPVPATAQGGTSDTGLTGTNSGSAVSRTNNTTITNRFNSRP